MANGVCGFVIMAQTKSIELTQQSDVLSLCGPYYGGLGHDGICICTVWRTIVRVCGLWSGRQTPYFYVRFGWIYLLCMTSLPGRWAIFVAFGLFGNRYFFFQISFGFRGDDITTPTGSPCQWIFSQVQYSMAFLIGGPNLAGCKWL